MQVTKRWGMLSAAFLAVALALPSGAAEPKANPKPKVVILATGGTIAGAQPKPGDVGYKAGAYPVSALIKAVPGIDEIAQISGEQIASIGSQDMTDAVWVKLGRRVNEVLADPSVSGVVVTHGTDTMEETGFFLNLVTKSNKPVVLVGSMRPATAVSADGPMNLYNATAVAVDPNARGRGVLVVLNDVVHYARETTKTNTTSLDTFASPNRGPAGFVLFGKVRWFSKPTWRHTTESAFAGAIPDTLPRVDIIYAHANVGPEYVQASLAAGAKGLVLAGVGDGNGTQALIEALSAAAKKGVVVVRSSRTNSGAVARNVELDDDKLGFVAAQELNPQKARVLLQLALTKTKDCAAIQEMFEQY
ncbi:type II asparaginase [Anaeromyxobacter oryzae]|uniref:L-asparaginase 2 n=1 Tax=Anaeromyxobacter oryzae TaxID=2918170 RepID=A0ABN6MNQ0_9BACT|nr:type II asparaginase [Anaeromyxobacter oryzae]BDG01930.1 L-asparaginase 2 [Anaeromyxobacter oryzae]